MEAATKTPQAQPDADAEKKAKRAAQEKARRARVKALETAELDPKTKLDEAQKERAENAPAGLRKKALAVFILEGKDSKAQMADGKKDRKVADRVEKAERSKKPGAALAARAASRAPDLRSAFLPADAQAFTGEILKTGKKGERKASDLLIAALAPEKEGAEPRDLPLSRLKAFAEKGEKDTEVRAFLKETGKGTRLWGRKLGLFIVEQIDAEGAAE